jgi:hypothetical protein
MCWVRDEVKVENDSVLQPGLRKATGMQDIYEYKAPQE